MISYFPFGKIFKNSPVVTQEISFQETLFNLLMSFVFFTALFLTIIHGSQGLTETENLIQREINRTYPPIIESLNVWYGNNLRSLSTLSELIKNETWQEPDKIQNIVNAFQKNNASIIKIYVFNYKYNQLITSPQIDIKDQKKLTLELKEKNKYLQNQKKSPKPIISNVHTDDYDSKPHVSLQIPIIVNTEVVGLIYASINLGQINSILYANINSSTTQNIIIDQNQRVIADSNNSLKPDTYFDPREGGEVREVSKNFFQWLPLAKENLPIILRWKKSYYIQQIYWSKFLPWSLIIKVSTAPYINNLQLFYINSLTLMLVIALIGLIASKLLSNYLASPLVQLGQLTTDLPHKLINQWDSLNIPKSKIIEINTLNINFYYMIKVIKEQFEQIIEVKNTLEIRVDDRTKELLDLNESLAQEINRRQKIEKILRESEERYALAVSGTNDGLWDWDLESNEMYYSPVWMKIIGEHEYLLPHILITWIERIYPDDLNNNLEAIVKHLQGETKIYEHTHRIRHKDGHYIWVEVKGKCLRTSDGEPYRMVGTITNITEKKQAEEELRKAKKTAEIANKYKSEFIANMSHEIRTPMNAILGFCDLMLDMELNERSRSYLQSIASSGRTLLALMNDILDLSKIEAQKLQLNYESVDIRILLEEIKQIFSGEVEKRSLDFYLFIDDSVPEEIIFDEVRLRQILFNVVGNALKFTESGYIKIQVESYPDLIGITLIISVEDTGIGIEKDQQERIFEMFTQQEGQSNRKYGGTGLGLTITKRLTEMLGGSISLDSEPGQGSIFTFMFPNVRDKTSGNESLIYSTSHKEIKEPLFSECLSNQIREPSLLIEKLELIEKQDWPSIQKAMKIRDLKVFQKSLKILSEYHCCENLQVYAERLKKEIETFDGDRLNKTIADFPLLVQKISRLLQ